MKKLFILVFCSLFLLSGCKNTSYFQSTELVEDTNKPEEKQSNLEEVVPAVIYVQVAGAVVNPGVYDLPTGSRLFAAIEAAGGFSEQADDSDLNQASILEDGQKIYVYTKEEQMILAEEAKASEAEDDGLLNINTASVGDLTNLPGIGEAKAKNIVAYRESNGQFSSIEDIKNVSGIGDGIFVQISSLIKI